MLTIKASNSRSSIPIIITVLGKANSNHEQPTWPARPSPFPPPWTFGVASVFGIGNWRFGIGNWRFGMRVRLESGMAPSAARKAAGLPPRPKEKKPQFNERCATEGSSRAAGNEHTVVLTRAGEVLTAGYNDNGQCGTGATARVARRMANVYWRITI